MDVFNLSLTEWERPPLSSLTSDDDDDDDEFLFDLQVEVEDDRALLSGAASGLGSDDALLGSGEDISTSPPNSP